MTTANIEFQGKNYTVEGTDQQIHDAAAQITGFSDQPKEPGLIDKVFNIPGAAVRSALQGTGYAQGAQNFQSVPKFQDQAIQAVNDNINKFDPQAGTATRFMAGLPASAAGLAADIATNPADLLTAIGGHYAEKALANTAVGQAINNVMNKEFRLVKFGGNEALRDAAVQAKSALGKIDNTFSENYKALFNQIGENQTPATDLHSTIVKSLDKTFDGSPTERFLQNTFDKFTGDISANDLHMLRQEIASKIPNTVLSGRMKPDVEQSALLDVYHKAQDMLSQPNMGGDAYKAITAQYADYQKNMAGYVKKMILDQMGNITDQNLKKMGSAPQNVQNAFEQLQATLGPRAPFAPNEGQTMLADINAVNRQRALGNMAGQAVKHALVWGGPVGAAIYGLKKLTHQVGD